MNILNLLKDTKIAKSNATVSGTTTITYDVDMAGFDSVLFVTTLGTTNAGNYLKCGQDTDSAYGTVADLTGTKVTPTGANPAAAMLNIHQPTKRYLRFSVVRGSASTIGEAYVIQYNAKQPLPIDNNLGASGSSVQFVESHVSPAEGTA